MYNKLFEEGYIGSHKIKNKTIMTAITTNFSHDNGEISNYELSYYKERIKGGVGAIITGMIKIDPFFGNKFSYQPSATHTKYISGLQRLTELAHSENVKIFAQLNHPGPQTFRSLNNNLQQISSSPYTPEFINEESRSMTEYEIDMLIDQFVEASILCERAGFDGIEIHAGHGYLLSSFLSKDINQRTDKYAYSVYYRGTSLLVKLIKSIKEVVGKDFAIIVRYNFSDMLSRDNEEILNDIKNALMVAKRLEEAGVDALDITCGRYESMYSICDADYYKELWKSDFIKNIKDNVNIPVIANNNIKTHFDAELTLENEIVDFVGLGRTLLADPYWVIKSKTNELIVPCIDCSHCFKSITNQKACECAVNPFLGRESYKDDFKREENIDKTVVIIGAGPSGCQLALNLDKKGYKVILFEKKNHIGGTMALASNAPYKDRLLNYIEYLKQKLEESNVEVIFETIPSVEDIKKYNPFEVFIATGSSAKSLDFINSYTYEDVLSGNISFKNCEIVVIGAGESGLETAEYLASNNKVSVIEATSMVGREMEYGARKLLLSRLKDRNVDLLLNKMIFSYDDKNKIITLDNEDKINADYIIYAIGVKPDSEYINKISSSFDKTRVLGDAKFIRNIYNATKDAVDIALNY